eukprot:gene14266-biopygen9592
MYKAAVAGRACAVATEYVPTLRDLFCPWGSCLQPCSRWHAEGRSAPLHRARAGCCGRALAGQPGPEDVVLHLQRRFRVGERVPDVVLRPKRLRVAKGWETAAAAAVAGSRGLARHVNAL